MTFREAFDTLKEKYGATAHLSFGIHVREDGSEFISIFAHGGGRVVNGETYEGVIASLNALHAGPVELPEGGE